MNKNNIKKNRQNKGFSKAVINVLILLTCIVTLVAFCTSCSNKKNGSTESGSEISNVQSDVSQNTVIPDNSITISQIKTISGNCAEDFDLYFLQMENEKKNKVYSPLSIKYALKMLEDGAEGDSKAQILKLIGNYDVKKYSNSENMSFANAFFIKDKYQNFIKDAYKTDLANKFGADVITDSFASPDTANLWIKNKTLGLIDNMFSDISQSDLLLINALAIDMDWEQKFILDPGNGDDFGYLHEDFEWSGNADVISHSFKDSEEEVSGMEIAAIFNNYDIVKTLGEENIRKTVREAFEEHLQKYPEEDMASYYLHGYDTSNLTHEQFMEKYLDIYIEEINRNYKREYHTTDFSLYVDDSVKVFAKNLKEYNGMKLQYLGIMPTNEDLDIYINKTTAKDIDNIIANLKGLKGENFKDGVITKITGFIPKFKFEYELDLMADLNKLGVTDVFEKGKANLSKISLDENLYISEAVHKANIEFTQDGIKAAAATAEGGRGAAGAFDYIYEVPVEEIDLTFDKPYMFLIRDVSSGEIWFAGTVYEPLLYSQDKTTRKYYIWPESE